MRTSKIAVVGCGAIGITTALEIQDQLRNGVQVTIFSKDFSPNLTSDVAAGLWEPYLLEMTSEERTTGWASETYQYLMANWEEANNLGIMLQPVTYITDTDSCTPPGWLKTTLGYSELPKRQVSHFSRQYKQKLTRGFHFVSFTWEASKFIPHFTKIFLARGGIIIRREIQDLWELSEFEIVVNCSGLASKDLVCDMEMKPVRGQVMKIKAPWQNHTYIIDCHNKCSYIIPNIELTTLGGTKQVNYNTSISNDDRRHIQSTCESILPSLRTAEVVREVVGLRPSRSKVRVEAEILQRQSKHLKVVHNYGHGGAGITLSIGCAKEAADLVRMLLLGSKM
nr:unnamed protein product [Callosobruchus chinensis]